MFTQLKNALNTHSTKAFVVAASFAPSLAFAAPGATPGTADPYAAVKSQLTAKITSAEAFGLSIMTLVLLGLAGLTLLRRFTNKGVGA